MINHSTQVLPHVYFCVCTSLSIRRRAFSLLERNERNRTVYHIRSVVSLIRDSDRNNTWRNEETLRARYIFTSAFFPRDLHIQGVSEMMH